MVRVTTRRDHYPRLVASEADLEPAYRAALQAVPPSSAADDALESAWAVASMAALSGEPALERAVEGLIDG